MSAENDFKELVYERWRHSERRCYFLMSASGAAIGYALVAVSLNDEVLAKISTSIALACWAIGFYVGALNLRSIQNEMEEVHRSLLVPTVLRGANNLAEVYDASWKAERDKLLDKQRQHEKTQMFLLVAGSLVYALERLGWLSFFFDYAASR